MAILVCLDCNTEIEFNSEGPFIISVPYECWVRNHKLTVQRREVKP